MNPTSPARTVLDEVAAWAGPAPSSPLASPWSWARVHSRVVAVLVPAVKKADVSMADTKGRESWTPKPFSLQIESFPGTSMGAMMAIADTLPAPSSPLASP